MNYVYNGNTGKIDKCFENGKIIVYDDNKICNKVEILKGESFTKVFDISMFELSRVLTGTEMLFVMYLSRFIEYESGKLSYSNGKSVNKYVLGKHLSKSIRSIEMLLKSLEEKQVIHKCKQGSIKYFVNPFLFMKGRKINKTLCEMFCNTKWCKLF